MLVVDVRVVVVITHVCGISVFGVVFGVVVVAAVVYGYVVAYIVCVAVVIRITVDVCVVIFLPVCADVVLTWYNFEVFLNTHE